MARLLVVGGGTAGWMAAALLAKHLGPQGLKVSLVESPDIGIIGVGEGSTPQLRHLFAQLGIPESEWMPTCDATYKLGIRFHQWASAGKPSSYFHPFPATLDKQSAKPFLLSAFERRQGLPVEAHPDDWFLNTELAQHPFSPTSDDVQYGYHFDAYQVGAVLGRRACALGVEHIQARVVGVDRAESGDVRAVRLEDGRELEADFFIDSTGFAGVLIEQSLGIGFDSFADNLFNDAAVVMPTQHRAPYACQTDACALSAGWRWSIPLQSRIGNGYVYSSSYMSAAEAEQELRIALGVNDDDVPVRHLKMRVGQRQSHWANNCLAVGLAQGFIEPLEATALHLVQSTVEDFIDCWTEGAFAISRRAHFNDTVRARFEGIRDYIVCHYQASDRSDTPYWQDCQNNTVRSDNLNAVLDAWRRREDITPVLLARGMDAYYSTLSWHCLLAGYGVYPPVDQHSVTHERQAEDRLREVRQLIARAVQARAPMGSDAAYSAL